jgi:hypothetical protein
MIPHYAFIFQAQEPISDLSPTLCIIPVPVDGAWRRAYTVVIIIV